MAELTVPRSANFATKNVGHQLHAVTDSEYRESKVEELSVASRCRWAENQTDRLPVPQPTERNVKGNNLRVDRQLTKTSRDELRVLRSEIQYQDGLMGHGYEPRADV